MYSAGASNFAEQLIAVAEYWGYIEKSGSWFVLPDGSKHQGAIKAAEALSVDEGLLFELKDKIWAREVEWMGDTNEE